jgi:hypothetical protein
MKPGLTLVQALQQVVYRQAAEVLAILIQHWSAEDVAAAQSLRAASSRPAAQAAAEGISSSPPSWYWHVTRFDYVLINYYEANRLVFGSRHRRTPAVPSNSILERDRCLHAVRVTYLQSLTNGAPLVQSNQLLLHLREQRSKVLCLQELLCGLKRNHLDQLLYV